MASRKPKNLRKDIRSVICLSSSGSDRSCHSCKTRIFIIMISSVWTSTFLGFIIVHIFHYRSKGFPVDHVSISDNLSPKAFTRSYSSLNANSMNEGILTKYSYYALNISTLSGFSKISIEKFRTLSLQKPGYL
jgi:hypothetical protein